AGAHCLRDPRFGARIRSALPRSAGAAWRHLLLRRAGNPRGRRRARGAGIAVHALERFMTASPKQITSLQNDRVKAIRALEMRKERKETGLFVAEGTSLLVTARDNGFVPQTLLY